MMSTILGKTMEQTISLLRGNADSKGDSDIGLKELQDSITFASRSARIKGYRTLIQKCIKKINRKSRSSDLTLYEKRESLLIVACLSNLNEDCGAVHPYVIKCIEDATTSHDKLLAYMALVLLNQNSPGVGYLAVNTLLKDLSNKSPSVICIALNAASFLVDVDLIPVFLPPVEKLLQHSNLKVTCKAYAVLHKMLQIAPEYLVSIWDQTVKALCDRNPHMMRESLPILITLLKSNVPSEKLKLHEKIIFILRQVEQGCLPVDMMYGGVCAPWTQIRLLQVIRTLPPKDFTESDLTLLQETLRNIFTRFQGASPVQYAIITECVYTIVSLHPKLDDLKTTAIDTVERFLTSSQPNLLMTGIELLKSLVTIEPGYSRHHAKTLLARLFDSSPDMGRHILHLIDDITCSENAESVIKAIAKNLAAASHCDFKKGALLVLLNILGKYPINSDWIMENYLPLLGLLGNEFNLSVIKKLLQCMQFVPDEILQKESLRLSKQTKKNLTAVQYCMVLEIFGFYNAKFDKKDADRTLHEIFDNCLENSWSKDEAEQVLLISWNTILSVAMQHNLTVSTDELTETAGVLSSTILREKYNETISMLQNLGLAKSVLPVTYSDVTTCEIDINLPFLDEFSESNDVSVDADETENIGSATAETQSVKSTLHKERSKFKTAPYSQTKFSRPVLADQTERIGKKNVFLNSTPAQHKPRTVWNKSDYVIDQEAFEDKKPTEQK